MLTADNITFGYGEKPLMRDVSLHLEEGRVLGILGPNGAGKTTLLRILSGFLKPWRGSVNLNNTDISQLSARQIARNIAVVPQQASQAFPYTVHQLVAMGRRPYHGYFGQNSRDDSQAVESALEQTGLKELAERPITRLSGGEGQLALVARAFAQRTPVMLLDEATSSLDIKHTLDILSVVRERVKKDNIAVGAIIHDINTAAAFCDSIVMLSEQGMLGPGKPEELLVAENLKVVYGIEPKFLSIQNKPLHVVYDL
ncbi:MAG: ABC transporter ATP-binding protein [Lentisphaeria bacterium]